MAMLDMIIKQIAPALGRSPQEIQQAINQAKKMLPSKISNMDEGKQILQKIGVGNGFIDEMVNKFGGLGTIFGMNKNKVSEYASQLKNDNLTNNNNVNTKQNNSSFNKNKYPKI